MYAPAKQKMFSRARKGESPLKRRLLGNPLWLSLVMTAVLAWIQIDVAYYIDKVPAHRQFAVYASAAAILVFFLLISVYVALGRRGGLLFWGESSILLGFTGIVAGANLLLNSGKEAWDFYQTGVAPAPYYSIFSSADRLFLHGTLIFGVLGGLAILVLGFLWMFGGKAGSTAGQWLSLFPILWAFCRLARYVMSYTSTIRNAFSAAQAALLILSLLFFYMFGQHLNGRLKLTGVRLPACAFAFGMMAVSAFGALWFVRTCMPEQIAGVVVITDVNDLLCGVFALAVGTVACSKKAAAKTAEFEEAADAAALAKVLGVEEDTPATVPLAPVEAPVAPVAEETAEEVVEDVVETPAEVPVEEAVEEAAEAVVEDSDVTE